MRHFQKLGSDFEIWHPRIVTKYAKFPESLLKI